MDIRRDQLATLLVELEQELQRLALWSSATPEPAALASNMPFCCDCLDLHQWLQWLFIPRIKHMLENDLALPTQCNVASYAEESWGKLALPRGDLITLIKRIDHLLSDQSA